MKVTTRSILKTGDRRQVPFFPSNHEILVSSPKKYHKAEYVQRHVQREENKFFIRGQKKFGGGGTSECGMTQSNKKK